MYHMVYTGRNTNVVEYMLRLPGKLILMTVGTADISRLVWVKIEHS